MIQLDWVSPQLTLQQVEDLVKPILGDNFDGLRVEGTYLYVVTVNQATEIEEQSIKNAFYKASNSPQLISVTSSPAFASKMLGTYKLYKRVVGIQPSVIVGENTILHTVTFPWVKMTGIELVNGENLDKVSFWVLDSETGQISSVPNYPLNQFGFSVNVSKDYYEHKSEFDADLYAGLQIKILYTSMSAKTIGLNFIFNEVK